MKSRYFDSDKNRYRIITVEDHIDHSITLDYANNVKVESYSDGRCEESVYEYDFDMGEYWKYFYDREAGKLEYIGVIDCEWNTREKYHGFVEKLE